MDINDKKIKRTSRLVNFLITFVLALFLILLSNVVIGDLDSSVPSPSIDKYDEQYRDKKLDENSVRIEKELNALSEKQSAVSKMIDVAAQNKKKEQESFENWVKTRNSLGSPNQDKEVLERAQKLDYYIQVEKDWQAKWDSLQQQVNKFDKEYASNQQLILANRSKAADAYDKAYNSFELKVFFVRLLFALPILAIGVFFFIRYRKHKFSALFMGFSLFSAYVFFVGLVPYLPSYGGYIRYTVGVLLSLGLGYYAISRIRGYMERKKKELEASGTERANKLERDTAEKAFNNHVCPSCGKDFILKNWEASTNIDKGSLAMASNYCRYCGLLLVKKCPGCGQANYAHLPFCFSCGTKIKE